MPPAQRFDDDAAIVEHAESCGLVARGVMQSGDRRERAAALARHDPLGCRKAPADDRRRDLEHAPEVRRVTGVEIAVALLGASLHEFDVGRRVEQQQVFDARLRRFEQRHAIAQVPLLELPQEGGVTIRAEGMPAGKSIASLALAHGYGRLRFLSNQRVTFYISGAAYHKDLRRPVAAAPQPAGGARWGPQR